MTGITVGVDGSADSLHAYGWATAVASRLGVAVRAVSAVQPVDSELWPDRWARQKAQARQQLEAWCRPLAETRGVEATFDAVEGDPRQVLLDAAAEHGSDLLVVGSGSVLESRASWLRIGSVAEYLARHSEVSLAIVAPGAATDPHHVVVGFDGSEPSMNAVHAAYALASGFGAPVTAVSAVREGERTVGQAGTDQVRSAWAAAGLSGELSVVDDRDGPAAALLDAVAQRSADVVVVGMRGLGGLLRLRIGSTALDVLHGAHDVTVVLVHQPEPA
jgi:nucleotide-binding universal stress UspA family protein